MSTIDNLGETNINANIQEDISLKQKDDSDVMSYEGIPNIESDTQTKQEIKSDKTEISAEKVSAASKQLPLNVNEHFITINEQNPQIPEIESEISHKACGDSKITLNKTNEADIIYIASEEMRDHVEYELDKKEDDSIQKQQEFDTKQLSNDETNETEGFKGTGDGKLDDNESINMRNASEITTLDVSNDDMANKDDIHIEITHVNKDKLSQINEESTNVLNEVSNEITMSEEPDANMEQNDSDDDFDLKWESDEANDSSSNVTLKLESGNNQAVEKCVGESSMNIDVHNDNLIMIKSKVNDIIHNLLTNIEDDSNNDEENSKRFENNHRVAILNETGSSIPIIIETVMENQNLDTISINTITNSLNETVHESTTKSDEGTSQSRIKDDFNSLIKTDHKLNEPDVMLEIPSQALIDTEDVNLTINSDQLVSSVNNNNINSMIKEMSTDQMAKYDDAKTAEDLGEIVSGKKICIKTMSNELETPEIQPSSSSAPDVCDKMTPDTSDEVPDVSDSLGLLAESSRVIEDDEDQDDDDEGDEDDDFDQDECSNQMTTEEHSENSSAQHSETEANIEQDEKEMESPAVESENVEFEFDINNIQGQVKTDLMKLENKDVEIKVQFIEKPIEMEAGNDVQVIEDVTGEEEKTLDDFEEEPVEMEAANDAQITEDVTGEEEEEKTLDAFDEESIEMKASNDIQATEDITIVEEKALDAFDEQSSEIDYQADIETVKLSDTSDNEADIETTIQSDQSAPESSKISNKEVEATLVDQSKLSPSKIKKLEVSQAVTPVFNIVDLEESSSEDEAREVKQMETEVEEAVSAEADGVTSVNLPTDIDVMCTSAGTTSEIVTKEGELVISGVPKPPPVKRARLNTGEVSIKTTSLNTESTLVIPEAKVSDNDARPKPKMCLEIFSLDSDEEETSPLDKEQEMSTASVSQFPQKQADTVKCINRSCGSGTKGPFLVADAATQMYYEMTRKKRSMVCQDCAQAVIERKQNLIKGIKDFCPLMDLGEDKLCQDLVEISDSESEDEKEELKIPAEIIGEKGAKLLEESLAEMMNETWRKFKMDARLKETTDILNTQIQELENESNEINQMLNECQIATDKLRNDLYATYEQKYAQVPSIIIYDTPRLKYQVQENDGSSVLAESNHPALTRQSKRRLTLVVESPAKRPAIPLGYAPLEGDSTQQNVQENKPAPSPAIDIKADDDKEVSVVKLSAEAAPADLPPPGDLDLSRSPLKVGMCVYAMRNAFGPWLKGRLLECQPKSNNQFTVCRVRFDHKVKSPCKILSARCLAYPDPAGVRMTIGTRVIALFKYASSEKRESFYSGVVAEMPNPVNNYRYLVFFDDGYAQYVPHCHTRLVCESSTLVWEEVHPFSRQFVRDYLQAYPERPMVRLHEGQKLETEWNGKWCPSRVIRVDASLAEVLFSDDGRKEWIYRGSTRLAPLYLELQAAERHRQRPMPRSKAQPRINMPYVEYTRSDEPANDKPQDTDTQHQQTDEIRRQRAVAKKSTAIPAPATPAQSPSSIDTVTSRVVYYTPKNAVKPYRMVSHTCSAKCKRSDVLSLKELRTYNPLAKPLLSGWERQIVRSKGLKKVMYRAPCGRRLRDLRELHRYLRTTQSELPVDLFDFHHGTHCLAEFVLNKCRVGKKDLSHGKENVPVPCVNYYDDSLPEFCSYNTERTPTAGVPLNLDPEFLCGCDCVDDCQNKSKCACWKMTLEGARTIGLDGSNVGYVYKRLPEPLPSGIYECNSRCKCKQTCLNRVAQHPLQLKLQVFKTLNRGWGIRALNDIPKGAFLCVYAGNLLTDATANLDGLNEGDEYLAELDYIEVVEQMKEGYEEDIPASNKKLDKKEMGGKNDSDNNEDDEDVPSSDDEDSDSKTEKDLDFRPANIGLGLTEFNKALRKRNKAKKEKNTKKDEEDKAKMKEVRDAKEDDDCITISDDEEVREPSRFSAQAGMGANAFISKYRSVRTHFGRDEACYIMDAKVQGNIGRYLNHSCSPNVFVQNVFVDTHDPRFPWVAFFALSHIKAGTELTWNYNYDVGSVPGKVLYCYCGAPNCRGRLL